MPIYVYKCEACGREVEEIRPVSRIDDPAPLCDGSRDGLATPLHAPRLVMERQMAASSFGFKTPGGNFAWFSPSHGTVTRGNRKPKTITTGDGLGGHRPVASPKNDPEFRAALVRKVSTEGGK